MTDHKIYIKVRALLDVSPLPSADRMAALTKVFVAAQQEQPTSEGERPTRNLIKRTRR